MAHVEKDIAEMRQNAAKYAQKGADLRKSGKNKEAKQADNYAKRYIDIGNEMRKMKRSD